MWLQSDGIVFDGSMITCSPPPPTHCVSCIDCGAPCTSFALCATCFAQRVPCQNEFCTARLNPNLPYKYCKRCTCLEPGCQLLKAHPEAQKYSKCSKHLRCKMYQCTNEISRLKSLYCEECTRSWDKQCVRCPLDAKPNFSQCGKLLCKQCFLSLPPCLSCRVSKIKVDAQGKSYNFCEFCLCAGPGCEKQRMSEQDTCCADCARNIHICNKLGKHGRCARLKSRANYAQCGRCCIAPKCTKMHKKNSPYCNECLAHYDASGAELCKTVSCYNYAQSALEPFCTNCAD